MPHRYDHTNTERKTLVYDVDTKQQIRQVLQINTHAGWILVADETLRLTKHHHVASHRIRFRAVYAICGGGSRPCLFHCYGRIEDLAP